MLLNHKVGYAESLDYTMLPGFERISDPQRKLVQEAYERAYRACSKTLGNKIAAGRAFETAKLALTETLKPLPKPETRISRSIFDGLENCQ